MKKIALFINVMLLITLIAATAAAGNITSGGSGNWNSTIPNAPWPGGTIPGLLDNVTISSGHTIAVTDDRSCASLTFSTAGTNAVLNINDDINFNVSGTISLGSQNTGSGVNTLSVGTGNLHAGSINIIGDNGQRKGLLSVINGTLTVNNNLTFSGISTNALLTFTGAGTLYIGGTLSTGGTLTAGSGTVNYTGTNQTVAPYTYNNLTLSGSGSDIMSSSVVVNGILSMAGTATASSAPTYGTSASLQYTGSSVQTTGPEFLSTMTNPVTMNNSIGVILGGPKTLQNTLTITNGWLDNTSPNTLTLGTGGSVTESGGYLIVPLPVEMTSFTATLRGSSALLQWSTATEINNAGFKIERSLEDSGNWYQIAFINGAGVSNVPKYYSYEDKNLAPGAYSYRIKQIDNDGTETIYTPISKVDIGMSNGFQLCKNYPNPFNPSTEIRFSVSQDGNATLRVYNIIGQEIETLFSGHARAGHYITATFNASRLASGIYFARLEYNGKSLVQRMILTK